MLHRGKGRPKHDGKRSKESNVDSTAGRRWMEVVAQDRAIKRMEISGRWSMFHWERRATRFMSM